MSMRRRIAAGKEYRQPYRDSRQWDAYCRNHGRCAHCRDNRLYQRIKLELSAREELRLFRSARTLSSPHFSA